LRRGSLIFLGGPTKGFGGELEQEKKMWSTFVTGENQLGGFAFNQAFGVSYILTERTVEGCKKRRDRKRGRTSIRSLQKMVMIEEIPEIEEGGKPSGMVAEKRVLQKSEEGGYTCQDSGN